jgi:trimethylamine--corrinoid protein Co-methyltransferase
MLAMAGIYSCGSATIDIGLLSLDEIYSPEQMVYDAELVGAIRHALRAVEVSTETCAVEDIAAVGPGGHFFGTDLTARRFRDDLWEPRVWDRRSLQDWQASGGVSERQRAKGRIADILATAPSEPGLTPDFERRLRGIIDRAIAANAADSS